MKKYFIISVALLLIGAVNCKPVKPPLKSRNIAVNYSAIKKVGGAQYKLYSGNKWYLQIDMNGHVSGTTDCSLPTVKMEMFSAGLAGVRLIKGVASGRYLALDKNGNIYSTKTRGEETIFLEKLTSSYSTFASYKFYEKVHYDAVIAVSQNGGIRTSTNKNKKGAQFSVLPSSVPC